MPENVTLNIVNPDTKQTYKKATVLVDDKAVLKSLFPTNNITEDDLVKIQEIARQSGDLGVLESSDLNPSQKLALATVNEYNEYYDIKLSKDGKYYEIKVKEAGVFTKDVTGYGIKRDFGLRENVLLDNNLDYMVDNAEPGSTPDGRNTDYDKVKFPAGTVIKLPVGEVNFEAGPSGFWRRLFQ